MQVWSVSSGTQLEEYLLHSDHVNCVLYSPTQPHILSAADNGIIKVKMYAPTVMKALKYNPQRNTLLSSRAYTKLP